MRKGHIFWGGLGSGSHSLSLSLCVFTGVCICPWGREGSTGKASVRCTMVLSAGRVYLDYELEGGPKVTPRIPFQ